MAHVSNLAKALAAAANDAGHRPTPVDAAPVGKTAGALFTPPDSTSPDLPAYANPAGSSTPPPINIAQEVDMQDSEDHVDGRDDVLVDQPAGGMPLSKGALSGLDASAAITPAMLAKDYLPGIMLNNGPRPIRYVMGELTHSVPGFSRIPPNRARRLVVAALESRNGGGPDGSVAFFKTGWGRWDAHVVGVGKDSGIGSFNDGQLSPPRSELSSYAISHGDSDVHMPRPRVPSAWRDQYSGGSWTASSLREEEEEDMDMVEHEADKMSLDGVSEEDDVASTPTTNDDTDDEDDWAAAGPEALRKASLPTPGAPRWNYKAYTVSKRRLSRDWSRRPSAIAQGIPPSTSPPMGDAQLPISNQAPPTSIAPAAATPEEKAAIAALLSLGASV